MTKRTLKALMVFITMFALVSPHVLAKSLKLGYVDISKVFDSYEKTKEENKELEGIVSKKQEQREKFVKEIQKLRDEMNIMSQEGKNKKRVVLEEKISQLQKFDRDSRSELKLKRDELMKQILDEIQDTIDTYAKKNDFDFIFYRNVLLYSVKNLDVTNEIINILNSKYKKSR